MKAGVGRERDRDPGGVAGSLASIAAGIDGELHLLTPGGVQPGPSSRRLGDEALRALVAFAERADDGICALPDGRRAELVAVPADRTRGEAVGHLVAVGTGSGGSSGDALRAGSGRVASALAMRAELRSARRAMADQLLARMVSGEATADELAAWARALRFEPRGQVTCVVVRGGVQARLDASSAADAVEDAADAHGLRSLATASGSEAVAFLLSDGRDAVAEHAVERLRCAFAPLRRGEAVFGSSSVLADTLADVVRSVHDARRVSELDLVRRPTSYPPRRDSAVPAAALILRRVDGAAEELRATVLGGLQRYDEQHGTDLRHTLDVFLTTGGQWTVTAAELGIHVNTLRYRLARVEKCTGRDMASTADRADLYIALRVLDGVERPPGEVPS